MQLWRVFKIKFKDALDIFYLLDKKEERSEFIFILSELIKFIDYDQFQCYY